MSIKLTLWQVWPDEANKPWVRLDRCYAYTMDEAILIFKIRGMMNDAYEYIITIS